MLTTFEKAVKVFPGPNNRGIFVTLPAHEEEYQVSIIYARLSTTR